MKPYAYEKKRTHTPISERRRPNTNMPRFKRNPLIYAVFTVVALYLLYSMATGKASDMPFRPSTENRLNKSPDRNTESSNFPTTTPEEIKHSVKNQGGHVVHPDVEKEQLMKDLTGNQQPASVSSIGPPKPDPAVEADEQSVAGRKMMPKPKEKPKYPVTSEDKSKVLVGEEPATNGAKSEKATDPATLEATAELDDILKRSPST